MAAVVAPATHTMHGADGQPLFTCLSCSIAFLSAEDQRAHYRSDHHRYNMKRRVANLPPVSASVFNQKVLDRRAETAVTVSVKDTTCELCKKVYGSEGAYRAHMGSKKHKDNELQAAIALSLRQQRGEVTEEEKKDEKEVDEVPSYQAPVVDEVPSAPEAAVSSTPATEPAKPTTSGPADVDMDSDTEIEQTLEQKLASARTHLTPSSCLFCPVQSSSIDANLAHMSSAHSFFLPDAEYLSDLPGLLTYLGEKIAIGNVCLYCNGKGRAFHSLEAVRKHMIDKGHCKVAYDSEEDRFELGEWYDFEKSYPRKKGKKSSSSSKSKSAKVTVEEEDEDQEMADEGEEWEDVSDDGQEADEIIEVSDFEEDSDSDSDDRPQITFGDTPFELVLPSGARIGHRSLKRYYDQSFSFRAPPKPSTDPASGAALVRKLIGDKNNQLVPRKGGFGAFGEGTDVVRARNVGEAREAGRHVKEFRDVRKREMFKTKIGFRNNHQKHYRDPLLQ